MNPIPHNYRSDLSLVEIFYRYDADTNELVATEIPDTEIDFEFVYRAEDDRTFTAGRKSGTYFNCKPISDKSIEVYIPLSRCRLGIGPLVHFLQLHTPNGNFDDGWQHICVPAPTGYLLHKGPSANVTTSATSVLGVEVPNRVFTIDLRYDESKDEAERFYPADAEAATRTLQRCKSADRATSQILLILSNDRTSEKSCGSALVVNDTDSNSLLVDGQVWVGQKRYCLQLTYNKTSNDLKITGIHLPTGIVQNSGESTDYAMSQKAVAQHVSDHNTSDTAHANLRELFKSGATASQIKSALAALGASYKDVYTIACTLKSFMETPATVAHNTTYSDLVSLRKGKKLVPGHWYRITDYVTTVAHDDEARSAGHPFDILVLATDTDTLSEEARAIVNASSAAYFATANLDAWKVWYCLDNDTTRFQWADETNGRGVIYRLIDEWQNDCPYDFKNIQFKRYAITDITNTSLAADALNSLKSIYCHNKNGGKCFATRNIYGYCIPEGTNGASYKIDEKTFEWYYTFHGLSSKNGETIDDNYDMSSHHFKLTDECLQFIFEDYSGADSEDECHDNIIRPAYLELDLIDECYKGRRVLNNIVFLNGLSYCYYEQGYGGWEWNISRCYGNVFGVECKSNTLGSDCFTNTFGDYYHDNTLGNTCYRNTFGEYFRNSVFGNGCSSNTFGDSCYDNTFGNECSCNTFGKICCRNTSGNFCQYNTVGNYCYGNTFGSFFTYNTCGNSCRYNTSGDYVRYLMIDNNVVYVDIVGGTSNSSICHAQILNGTTGSPNRLQISFKAGVRYCQFAGLDSSGILKIWTPADLV